MYTFMSFRLYHAAIFWRRIWMPGRFDLFDFARFRIFSMKLVSLWMSLLLRVVDLGGSCLLDYHHY